MLRLVAVETISMYQRHLSPYKGFTCAFRQHTGRCSCSEFARRVTLRYGILRMLKLLPGRFKSCKAAYMLTIQSNAPDRKNENSSRDSSLCCKEGGYLAVGCCPWP